MCYFFTSGDFEGWTGLDRVRLYFGFDHPLNKQEFSAVVEAGLNDKQALTGLLNEVKVDPGEVYLGLPKEVALDCFDCGIVGPGSVALAKKTPRSSHPIPKEPSKV